MKRSSVFFLGAGACLGLFVGLTIIPFLPGGQGMSVPVWMEVIQRICTSIGGLGTFIALIFVARQFNLLHAQSELVQRNTLASMDGQLYARLDSFNKFIVEHDKEYEMLNKPYPSNEPTEFRNRLHHMCDLAFSFFEEIYKHHIRYRLLDTEDWEEWQQNMAHFFQKPYAQGYWPKVAGRFARSFQAFVNELLAQMGAVSPAGGVPATS